MTTPSITVRKCEVLQLEGAALEACTSTVACEGCEPGWCCSEVWRELVNDVGVADPPNEYFPGLRFVLGADSAAGVYRVTCNVASPRP